MRGKTLPMLLAAALLAGTAFTAMAEDTPPPRNRDRECMRGDRDDWKRGQHRGEGREMRGSDGWHRGPGRGPGGPGGPGFHRGEFGFGHRGFGPGLWTELNLDATQKSKVVDILTNHFRAGLEARMELMEAKKKLQDLQKDATVADADIIAANESVGIAKGKLQVARRGLRDELRQVLTTEQQTKLDEMRKDRGTPPGDGKWDGKRPQRQGMKEHRRGMMMEHGPRG